ncbi:transposase [Streptomyces sp. NBC_00005]|uniref:transposase n=1 Tax=Streptomyces sp. NBC_00005 TaxID=2903609 RepID=UPI00386A633E
MRLINGRKRQLICEHRSLVLLVMVTPADAQDSLVARELLFHLAFLHPEIAIVRADSAYAKNQLIPWAKKSSTSPSRRYAAHRTPKASSSSCAAGQLNAPGHAS